MPRPCPRWLVVRVAGLFGAAPVRGKDRHFVDAILAKANAGKPLTVIDDVRMSPTYTLDAAQALELLVRRQALGLIHVTNAGSCSRYEFATKTVCFAGLDAVRRVLPPWDEALKAYLAAGSSVVRASNAT